MAPHRSVGAPRRPDQAHRLPRDHQTGDSGSHRETAHGQYGPGKRPAGAPHPRPAGRFRALARAVEKGASVALGRARAVGGRKADRRARARDHRFPLGRLFPRRGAVPRRQRPRKDALQGRTRIAFRNRGAGRGVFEKLHRRDLHGGESPKRNPPSASPHRRSPPRRSSRRPGASWACPYRRRCPWPSTSTSRVSSPTCVPTR